MDVLTEDQLWQLDVPAIKRRLHEHKLPRHGNKEHLIQRLLNFWRATANANALPSPSGRADDHGFNHPGASSSRTVLGQSGPSSWSGTSGGIADWPNVPRTAVGGQGPQEPNPFSPPQRLQRGPDSVAAPFEYYPPLDYDPPLLPLPAQPYGYPSFSPSSQPHASAGTRPQSGPSIAGPPPPPHQYPSASSSSSASALPYYPPPIPDAYPPVPYYGYPYPPSFSFPGATLDAPPPHQYPPPHPPNLVLPPPPPHVPAPHPSQHQPPLSSLAGPSSARPTSSGSSSSAKRKPSLSLLPLSPQPPPPQRARSTTFDLSTLHLVPISPIDPLPLAEPWRRVLERAIVCGSQTVGSMRASFVRREVVGKGTFHRVMWEAEMESGELGELALEGFDTDGRVRGELLGGQGGGGKESGSGAWGAELSRGTFVYLHSLEITSPSQGLGFTAFRSLLGLLDTLKANRVIPYIPPFIITRPRLLPLPSDQASAPTPEYKEFATQRAVRFFRKVGFRRLGMTDYFVYAVTDVNHPSRHIPVDRDSPSLPPLSAQPPTSTHSHLLSHQRLPNPIPTGDLTAQDAHGRTPLHIAVVLGLEDACVALIEADEDGEGRRTMWMEDARGLIPVEAGKRELRVRRDRREAMGDEGGGEEEGGEDEAVERCVELLEGRIYRV